MLLRCSKDEHHMCRWLFQRLKKGIESRLRKHVYLVDDKDLVLSNLWRYSCLIHKTLDMINTIVAGSIKLKDIHWALLRKGLAALTLATGIAIVSGIGTVDDLGKDTRTSSLAYTAWSAEEICVCKFSACHSILKCCGECLLSYDSIEWRRTVFPGWNDIFQDDYELRITNYRCKGTKNIEKY